MSSPSTPDNTPPRRRRRNLAAEAAAVEASANVRPQMPDGPFWGVGLRAALDGTPPFTFAAVPRMLFDPMIRICVSMRTSLFLQAGWTVECGDPVVKKWIDGTLHTCWTRLVPALLGQYFGWGHGCVRPTFNSDNGFLDVTGCRLVTPLGSRPHVWTRGPYGGQFYGTDMASTSWGATAERSPLAGDRPYAPQELFVRTPFAVWYGGLERVRPLYDHVLLQSAHMPWLEKSTRGGGLDTRRTYYRRMAIPPILWRVPRGRLNPQDPNSMTNADYAAKLAETIENNSTIIVPDDRVVGIDGRSEPQWEAKAFGATIANADVLAWLRELDKEITRGMEIPPEVLDNAEAGSGYSGRQIPQQGLYAMTDQLVIPMLEAIDRCLLRELVPHNFGDRVRWRVRHMPVEEAIRRRQVQGDLNPFGSLDVDQAEAMVAAMNGQQPEQVRQALGGPAPQPAADPKGSGLIPGVGPKGGSYALNPQTGQKYYDAQHRAAVGLSVDPAAGAGCLLVPLPEPLRSAVLGVGRDIPDADLAADGREADPHVTVRHGFREPAGGRLFERLAGLGSLACEPGEFGAFRTPDHDVLYVAVANADDWARWRAATDGFDCDETHPEYVPHVTVAYLKPGLADKYLGGRSKYQLDPAPCHAVDYCGPDGRRESMAVWPTADQLRDALFGGEVHLGRGDDADADRQNPDPRKPPAASPGRAAELAGRFRDKKGKGLGDQSVQPEPVPDPKPPAKQPKPAGVKDPRPPAERLADEPDPPGHFTKMQAGKFANEFRLARGEGGQQSRLANLHEEMAGFRDATHPRYQKGEGAHALEIEAMRAAYEAAHPGSFDESHPVVQAFKKRAEEGSGLGQPKPAPKKPSGPVAAPPAPTSPTPTAGPKVEPPKAPEPPAAPVTAAGGAAVSPPAAPKVEPTPVEPPKPPVAPVADKQIPTLKSIPKAEPVTEPAEAAAPEPQAEPAAEEPAARRTLGERFDDWYDNHWSGRLFRWASLLTPFEWLGKQAGRAGQRVGGAVDDLATRLGERAGGWIGRQAARVAGSRVGRAVSGVGRAVSGASQSPVPAGRPVDATTKARPDTVSLANRLLDKPFKGPHADEKTPLARVRDFGVDAPEAEVRSAVAGALGNMVAQAGGKMPTGVMSQEVSIGGRKVLVQVLPDETGRAKLQLYVVGGGKKGGESPPPPAAQASPPPPPVTPVSPPAPVASQAVAPSAPTPWPVSPKAEVAVETPKPEVVPPAPVVPVTPTPPETKPEPPPEPAPEPAAATPSTSAGPESPSGSPPVPESAPASPPVAPAAPPAVTKVPTSKPDGVDDAAWAAFKTDRDRLGNPANVPANLRGPQLKAQREAWVLARLKARHPAVFGRGQAETQPSAEEVAKAEEIAKRGTSQADSKEASEVAAAKARLAAGDIPGNVGRPGPFGELTVTDQGEIVRVPNEAGQNLAARAVRWAERHKSGIKDLDRILAAIPDAVSKWDGQVADEAFDIDPANHALLDIFRKAEKLVVHGKDEVRDPRLTYEEPERDPATGELVMVPVLDAAGNPVIDKHTGKPEMRVKTRRVERAAAVSADAEGPGGGTIGEGVSDKTEKPYDWSGLAAVIAKLRDKYRGDEKVTKVLDAFDKRFDLANLDAKSQADLAEELGLSTGTVSNRMKAMRDLFEREGVTPDQFRPDGRDSVLFGTDVAYGPDVPVVVQDGTQEGE